MAAARALVVVGGGKMGEALVAGLIRSGSASPSDVAVVEKFTRRRAELSERYEGLGVTASLDEALGAVDSAAGGVVIAVKPADVRDVCIELRDAGVARILSIAAGITISSLESWLRERDRVPAVIRAMPNTPSLVGAGMAAISPGTAADRDDLDWARGVLESVGSVVEMPEPQLDAATGLSGSGPAYVFLIAEALIDAGVLVGLPREVARQLATQTLLGASRLLAETGEEPSALRAAVTSPGGTTAAGLGALEAAGVRNAILDAVVAATERSRQLGQTPST